MSHMPYMKSYGFQTQCRQHANFFTTGSWCLCDRDPPDTFPPTSDVPGREGVGGPSGEGWGTVRVPPVTTPWDQGPSPDSSTDPHPTTMTPLSLVVRPR